MSNIHPRGGVSIFQISLKLTKSLKYLMGGRVKPILENVQNFPVFNYEASPKSSYTSISHSILLNFNKI